MSKMLILNSRAHILSCMKICTLIRFSLKLWFTRSQRLTKATEVIWGQIWSTEVKWDLNNDLNGVESFPRSTKATWSQLSSNKVNWAQIRWKITEVNKGHWVVWQLVSYRHLCIEFFQNLVRKVRNTSLIELMQHHFEISLFLIQFHRDNHHQQIQHHTMHHLHYLLSISMRGWVWPNRTDRKLI